MKVSIGRGVSMETAIAIAKWRANPVGPYPGPEPRGRGPGKGTRGRDRVALVKRAK